MVVDHKGASIRARIVYTVVREQHVLLGNVLKYDGNSDPSWKPFGGIQRAEAVGAARVTGEIYLV